MRNPDDGLWPTLAALRGMLHRGETTATELVSACLRRIEEANPLVRAVVALDPTAWQQASEFDHRHRAGTSGPLDGIPILVKDNVDTAGLATTAGSRLMAGTPPQSDADVVALLRQAGAIVLGKTNLSEWGNFRSTAATEGWSAVGGQTWNPYLLDHSPWGSSSGSAVAVATGMVPLAIGTETDGSLVCPAAVTGVVGMKPELGLLPGRGVVPISAVQDTPGLLTTTVADAMTALGALTGGRPGRPVSPVGLRVGVWQGWKMAPEVHAMLEQVAEGLRDAGAIVVQVDLPRDIDMLVAGLDALIAEFRPSLESYLRTRPGVPNTMDALIEGNRADPLELRLFGQDLFELANGVDADKPRAAVTKRANARHRARAIIEEALTRQAVRMIVAPTCEPAWRVDHDAGDRAARSTSTIPALAGYPNVTVPTGFVGALPVGVSVFGPRRTTSVLELAATVEKVCGERRPPTFLPEASRA